MLVQFPRKNDFFHSYDELLKQNFNKPDLLKIEKL